MRRESVSARVGKLWLAAPGVGELRVQWPVEGSWPMDMSGSWSPQAWESRIAWVEVVLSTR